MALYVQTNVSSLNSQRALSNATRNLDTTYQRLSSGLRINSAKDDAAGLQISNRLTSQINGLYQGNRNANDGIALAQTMEGALDETTSMLQRIRTLALQSANGTNTSIDRKSIQQEITQLSQEISRIACKTTYAGQQCLAGAKGILAPSGTCSFQVGAYAYDTIDIDMSCGFTLSGILSLGNMGSTTGDWTYDQAKTQAADTTGKYGLRLDNGIMRFSASTAAAAQETIIWVDRIINNVDTKRAELGAVENRLESTIRNQANIRENVSDARARIRDTDFAEESSNLTAQNIIQQASSSILTQANQKPQIALSLLQGG